MKDARTFRFNRMTTYLKSLLIITCLFFLKGATHAQYFSEANNSGFYLKKVVSDTLINSGQTFTYTIYFSIPAGATAVTLTDVIPANLVFQGYTVTAPCGTMNVPSMPTVGNQGGTLQLQFPSVVSGCSGSVSVTVNFPNGVTCDKDSALNRVCMTGRLGTTVIDLCTGFVKTVAKAINPWHINKYVLGTAYQGGSCPNVTLDSIITYRLYVWKDNGTTGQLNMYNATVTDILPAGAVMVGTPSCTGISQSGGLIKTITWNIGALSALPAFNQAYCDIQVLYPRAYFPVGSQVNNQSTLTGGLGSAQKSCGQANLTSNQTCVEIRPFASGTFSKTVYTTGQPGCGGYYWLQICNNGTLPINGFTVKDTIPTTLSTPSVTGTSSGVSASISGNIVTATYSGVLNPTQCAWIKISFTIPATATIGNNITNCAWLTSPSLTSPIKSCTTFPVTAPKAQPCLWKEVCSELPSYLPGQTFRYRLRVQNIGGQAITGASLTDVLNPNLQYVGNPTYYTASSYNIACSTPSLPSGATAWTGVTFSQSGQNLTWNLPNIGATCQDYFWGNCGQYGTWGVPFYFIEFDVKVRDTACLGNIPNFFTINGGNISTAVNSNIEYVTVGGTAAFNLDKTVSKDNGATFANAATVASGSNVQFRLHFSPSGSSTAAMRHVTFVDLLPKDDGTNDKYILNRGLSRNGQFNFNFLNTAATTPLATQGYDGANLANVRVNNINIPSVGNIFPYTGGTGIATWTNAVIPANSKNFTYYFGSAPIASPSFARADFNAQVPASTPAQQTSCNTFAANAAVCHLINSSMMTHVAMAPLESPTACVSTTVAQQESCCDSVIFLQPHPAMGACCSRISAKCDIKNVTVNVTNGTISGAMFLNSSTTCYNNPSPAIGQTNYTFTPVSGVCAGLDMAICANPTTSGMVIIDYSIVFANGTICRKSDTLKCEVIDPTDCCKETQVVSYPNGQKCCSQLVTKCPVKLIQVTMVSGGTLGNVTFGGASAGFYTGLTNSNLTTANFGASSAPSSGIDITVCPKATSNPVIIRYVINFTNGQKCEKYDTLKCPIAQEECIINACFGYTATGLNVNFNASSTTSNQPIVVYYWNFGDGTTGTSATPTINHTYTANGTYKVCMTVYTNFGGGLCICYKEFCREIKIAQGTTYNVSCISGVSDNVGTAEIGKIVASPNPSTANFHIKLENATEFLSKTGAEVRVMNAQGSMVFSKKLAVSESELDIPAETYPAGMYFVSLLNNGELISTIKVVKN